MTKATLAKILAGISSGAIALQTVIQAQGVPHTLNDWLKLIGAAALYFAVHHASNTGGNQ